MGYILRRDVAPGSDISWIRKYWWAGDTEGWVDVRYRAFSYSTREKVRTAQEALKMLAKVEETEGRSRSSVANEG
jgi:hypothetical protein